MVPRKAVRLGQHPGEGADRGRGIFLAPDGLAHGEEIGAGFDQRPGIVRRDAADGDAGDLEQPRPPGGIDGSGR